MRLIWGLRKAEYFSPHDWTTQIRLKGLAKFVFARTWILALVSPCAKRDAEEFVCSARRANHARPPLPLWERSDRIVRCDPGEGFVSADRNPHPARTVVRATFSHKGRRNGDRDWRPLIRPS
jgi:hypothetical protein